MYFVDPVENYLPYLKKDWLFASEVRPLVHKHHLVHMLNFCDQLKTKKISAEDFKKERNLNGSNSQGATLYNTPVLPTRADS